MENLNKDKDLNNVNEHQLLGNILVKIKKITVDELNLALDVQNVQFKKSLLGNILLRFQLITKECLQKALQMQKTIDNMIEGHNNEH